MKKGIIIYSLIDSIKNAQYIEWMQSEALMLDIILDMLIVEDFNLNVIKDIKKVDFMINRTRNYNISLIFELNKIRVFNNSEITLIGNNKLAGYQYANKINIEFPEIFVSRNNISSIISKPIYGHGGNEIKLESDIISEYNNKYLYQQFVGNLIGDVRFYIINNQIVHAILRTNNSSFLSNYSKGGDFCLYKYNDTQKKIVEKFIRNLKIDYAGVDFLLTKDNNIIFNEVEDVVGSRMLSELGINNTTELFMKHIKANI